MEEEHIDFPDLRDKDRYFANKLVVESTCNTLDFNSTYYTKKPIVINGFRVKRTKKNRNSKGAFGKAMKT